MPTIIEKKSNFEAHPEGSFLAVMRDAFLEERDNPWKNRADEKTGKVDLRETITEINLEFLTSHSVMVNGVPMPGYVRYKASATTGEGSNLRALLKSWFPQLKDGDFKRFDADKLIGRGAYITVRHNVSRKNGLTYANVTAAMQPPPGSVLPEIPSDFVRRCNRPEFQQTQQKAVDSIRNGEDEDLSPPF